MPFCRGRNARRTPGKGAPISCTHKPLTQPSQTRSGKDFSPWQIDGETFSALPTTSFDFGALLKLAVAHFHSSTASDLRPLDNAADFPADDTTVDTADGALDPALDDPLNYGHSADDALNDAQGHSLGAAAESGPNTSSGPLRVDAPNSPGPASTQNAPFATPLFASLLSTPSQTTALPLNPAPGTTATAEGPPPREAFPSRKAWRAGRDKRRSKEKSARRRDAHTEGAQHRVRALVARHIAGHGSPQQTDVAAADMPHVSTGYQGARDDGAAKRLWTAKECVERWGHAIKKWDGK